MSARPRPVSTLATICGWLLFAASASSAAQMSARLDRDTIYLGTQTLLVVEVQDDTGGAWPTVQNVEGLQISRYGSPSLLHDLFRGTVRRSYRFLIKPAKAGTFKLPSVTLNVGGQVLTKGPFTLQVQEAALKCIGAKLDPTETLVGQSATLVVGFQGYRPGLKPVLPRIEGLSIEPMGEPRTEISRQDGTPLIICQYRVTPTKLGAFNITGITFGGVPADAVALTVSPFIILGLNLDDQTLLVGAQTTVQLVTRGLPASAKPTLVGPPGLKITPPGQPSAGAAGTTLYTFSVTATEPGSPTISAVKLADGRQIPLKQPVSFSVRQAGEGGILSFTGKARSDETTLGEPFMVDFDVFFRGDLEGAAVDPSNAAFANKPYIKVEPVSGLTYPGWQGRSIGIGFGADNKITALLGNGDLNGRKEQRMRFALRLTPLAAGELPLGGLRVIVQLRTTQQTGGAGFFSSITQSQRYDSVADLPPHRVVEPRGKKAPAGYRGAVGTGFAFVTELDRATAAAMSPLTLTMKITGDSVGPQFQPPALSDVPELTRDFDVSPTTSGGEVQGNTITFTRVIRPLRETVRELPALPLIFYNYRSQKYETTYSLPIAIVVRSGSIVGAQAMQMAAVTQPAPTSSSATPVENRPAVLVGSNYASLGQLVRPEPLSASGMLAVLLGGPLTAVLIFAGSRVYRTRRPGYQLRHQRRGLIAQMSHLGPDNDFFVQLADLLQSYLRLRFELPPGELSAAVLDEALRRHGVSGELLAEAQDLLARCDVGRFATSQLSDGDRSTLTTRASELCSQLERGAG